MSKTKIIPWPLQVRPLYNRVVKRQATAYIIYMKYLNWNSNKKEILKRERGISFEEIAYLIESDKIIGIEENLGFANQIKGQAKN